MKSLDEYRKDCQVIKKAINILIDDFKYVQNGGIIEYTIDFSEIYSYLFPTDSVNEFIMFSHESLEQADIGQQIVLRHLFHNIENSIGNLILLPTYAIELESFLLEVQHKSINDIIGNMPVIFNKFEEIRHKPDFTEILNLAKAFKEKNRFPGSDELKNIVKFLENNAYDIFSLLESRQLSRSDPLTKIKSLFNKKLFISFEDILKEKINYDNEVFIRWMDKLTQLRPNRGRGSSHLDSISIALIYNANKIILPQRKIVLISRSKHMLSIFDKEFKKGLWDEAGGYILRHPQIFQLLHLIVCVHKYPYEDAIIKLNDWLESIEIFLKSLRDTKQDDIRTVAAKEEVVNRLLQDIRKDLRSSEALTVSVEESEFRQYNYKKDFQDIKYIFDMIDDLEDLKEGIFDRLRELAFNFERQHELLGLYFQGLSHDSRNSLESLASERYGDKIILRTNLHAMPYTLQFHSDEAKNLLQKFEAQGKTISWLKLIEFFKEGFKENDYERLLAMAYIMGTLNKWKFAEIYCKRSLEVAKEKNELYPFEGYFFLAICKRKFDKLSIEKSLEAIDLIDKAIDTKHQWSSSSVIDPRYLKEKGYEILAVHLYLNEAQKNEKFPSAEEGIKFLNEAEKNVKEDLRLKIQICNNRLYYYISLGKKEYLCNVEKEYNNLLNLQLSLSPDKNDWTASVLDTLAWSEWVLYSSSNKTDRDRIIRRLQTAYSSQQINLTEKSIIEKHLKFVQRNKILRLN